MAPVWRLHIPIWLIEALYPLIRVWHELSDNVTSPQVVFQINQYLRGQEKHHHFVAYFKV